MEHAIKHLPVDIGKIPLFVVVARLARHPETGHTVVVCWTFCPARNQNINNKTLVDVTIKSFTLSLKPCLRIKKGSNLSYGIYITFGHFGMFVDEVWLRPRRTLI